MFNKATVWFGVSFLTFTILLLSISCYILSHCITSEVYGPKAINHTEPFFRRVFFDSM